MLDKRTEMVDAAPHVRNGCWTRRSDHFRCSFAAALFGFCQCPLRHQIPTRSLSRHKHSNNRATKSMLTQLLQPQASSAPSTSPAAAAAAVPPQDWKRIEVRVHFTQGLAMGKNVPVVDNNIITTF